MIKYLLTLIGCFFLSGAYAQTVDYVVLSALPDEMTPVVALLHHKRSGHFDGFRYTTGKIGSHSVVVSMSGMGRVAAAATAALFIERFKPKAVLFVGSSGSLQKNLKIGSVVVSKAVYNMESYSPSFNRQFQSSGIMVNPPMLNATSTLAKNVSQLHFPFKVVLGVIADTDQYPTPRNKLVRATRHGFSVTASEDIAVAIVANHYHLPWLCIRGVSNQAAYFKAHKIEYPVTISGTKLASQHAAAVLGRLLQDASY